MDQLSYRRHRFPPPITAFAFFAPYARACAHGREGHDGSAVCGGGHTTSLARAAAMDRRSRLAAISQRGGGATERDLSTSTVPSDEQPRRQTQHQIACWSVLPVNHIRSDLNPIGCTGFPSASPGVA